MVGLMELSQSDISILLSWWEFIQEVGETDGDEGELDLVARLKAHAEESVEI